MTLANLAYNFDRLVFHERRKVNRMSLSKTRQMVCIGTRNRRKPPLYQPDACFKPRHDILAS